MPPMITIASSSPENDDRGRVGRREAVMEREQHARESGQRRRNDIRDLLVAIGRVTDELRALLVLANGDEHAADRGRVEALQSEHDCEARKRDKRVVDPAVLEIEPSQLARVTPPSPLSPPVNDVQRNAIA